MILQNIWEKDVSVLAVGNMRVPMDREDKSRWQVGC